MGVTSFRPGVLAALLMGSAAVLGGASAQDGQAPAQRTWAAAPAEPGLPVPAEFVRKVREAILDDYEAEKNYTYIETRSDVKVSALGKVTVGPVRTFEVYPSNIPGETYKRLIAVAGKPLDAADFLRGTPVAPGQALA